MKILYLNENIGVPRITRLSSFHHNTHIEKSGLWLHRPPLCRWSRILLLNFCNSIDNPQGNQCRARSIVIVQYTFTTSRRLKIFRPVCMELSMNVQKTSCMLVYLHYNKSVRQNFHNCKHSKTFIITFQIDKICTSELFGQKRKSRFATALWVIRYRLYFLM